MARAARRRATRALAERRIAQALGERRESAISAKRMMAVPEEIDGSEPVSAASLLPEHAPFNDLRCKRISRLDDR